MNSNTFIAKFKIQNSKRILKRMEISVNYDLSPQYSVCESFTQSPNSNDKLYFWTVINHENYNDKKKIHHTDRYQKKAYQKDYLYCPKTFNDIFRDPNQLDHFKKFLVSKCNGSENLLLFVLAINELKKSNITPDRVVNLNRYIKNVLLGANSYSFLKVKHPLWIQLLKTQTPSIQLLVEAQKLIYREVKDNYYDQYVNKFPKEGDFSSLSGPNNELVNKERKLALWTKFIKAIINFKNGLMNTNTFNEFKTFLSKESKQFSTSPMRIMGDKIVNTNRIVKDIEFWSEVERFKTMYDDRCNKDLLFKKAKTIIHCFLDSNVPPKIQVNVQSDTSQSIIQHLDTESATRGLFHEAQLSVFMNLIIFWKRYRNAINAIDEHGYNKYQQLPLLVKQVSLIQTKQNDKSEISRKKINKNSKINCENLILKEQLPKISYSLETRISSPTCAEYTNRAKKNEATRLPLIKKH